MFKKPMHKQSPKKKKKIYDSKNVIQINFREILLIKLGLSKSQLGYLANQISTLE